MTKYASQLNLSTLNQNCKFLLVKTTSLDDTLIHYPTQINTQNNGNKKLFLEDKPITKAEGFRNDTNRWGKKEEENVKL